MENHSTPLTDPNGPIVPPATTPVPPASDPTVESGYPQKKGFNPFMIIGCILLALLVCCGAFFGFLALGIGTAANTFKDIAAETNLGTLCEQDPDLEGFYQDAFTESYKNRVDFEQFEHLYENNSEIFTICNEHYQNINIMTVLKGTSLSYSNNNGLESMEATTRFEGVVLIIEFAKEGEEWKIDNMSVH